MQRRLVVGVGVGLAALGGGAAWWLLSAHALGLAEPRIALAAGEPTVDGHKVKVGQAFDAGQTVRTGDQVSACFSVHASRACLGAQSEVRLAALTARAATLELARGTLIVASAGDDVTVVTAGGASVEVKNATAALETGQGDALVRALDASVTLAAPGKPPMTLASPSAVGLRDAARRPGAPAVEDEERQVARLASRWQGSAGAIVELRGAHGRLEVDGLDAGHAPAAVLLDEGEHTLAHRAGPHGTTEEKVSLRGGQVVVRGE